MSIVGFVMALLLAAITYFVLAIFLPSLLAGLIAAVVFLAFAFSGGPHIRSRW